jgi:predicted ATPase
LSPTEILDGLHDRYRLLTRGARTVVRRQQTLRASVDWSHALLSEPEQVLFRRVAVFLGGFDLDAAQAVAGGGDVEHYQVLDQLTLLVPNSLVLAEDSRDGTRYRLLETVRQYALENSASPAKVTTCAPITATTTQRWPPCSTRQQTPTTNGASNKRKPKSTIYEPLSRGAVRVRIPSWH